MYNKTAMSIPANDELTIVGASHQDTNRYVCTNLPGVYVQASSNLYMFNTSYAVPFKYIMNTIPYRACTEIQLHCFIYPGSMTENTQFLIYSHNLPFTSAMGMYLDEPASCALVNIPGKTITSNNAVKSYCVFNTKLPFTYTNKVASKGSEFVYVQNCIMQQFVNIKYSSIVHPLMITTLRPIYENIDIAGNDPFTFPITVTTNNLIATTSVTLRKLKMFFSANGVAWYTYNKNTQAFVSVTPGGTYFSFNELCTNGTDYETYASIPIAKFNATFGVNNTTNMQVLSNGWVLPRFAKHIKYSNILDNSQFMWTRDATVRTTIYTGDI